MTTPLPAGFQTAAVEAGVKPGTSRLDLALFISEAPCAAAGVFTTNLVCGAPVKVSRERLPRGTARGVVINAGNANACTGEQGIRDAQAMATAVGQAIGCPGEDILVCSTGVIGRLLPIEKIVTAIGVAGEQLSPTTESFDKAARSIMTTDTFPKQVTRELHLAGGSVRITGVCKGAAMIAPNMATMLGVIMTDAKSSPEVLQEALSAAVADSFNCISVDGHESTSDSVILLANGLSHVDCTGGEAKVLFAKAVADVAMELAQLIIKDAEGASHFVTIDVTGCRSREEAFKIAKTVADSALVKTAICGADPNWGRIVSAAGYAGVPLKEEEVSLWVNGIALYESGVPLAFDAAAASKSMRENRDIHIDLRLTHGNGSIRFWTSDLTKEYVALNADYTT
ncbi:bifunctional glutamate N-acetyltransferase/amino-acid acetyltransferase ArgJ [Planctopirus hydrillae]|uniref:Arginine biosynthesis bifunctional protein ArgJ n=1 Tax=Planctopirus hydrillae TaxID=1841610 RepID=A0A1C3EU36_9PLAN|nr:bifunctional glutamate N-acetyltransferase/amino-acid acetyltransferase ArgJ [Planctopirus hydrillae]ODA36623.1 bifunctional ornithine acetyltransferase/N-acetylglutamate synthase [Planctopirus hydrillae]